jgi:hypothetical protein
LTAFDQAWNIAKDFVIARNLRDPTGEHGVRGFTDQQVKPIYQIGAPRDMQGSTTPWVDAALAEKDAPRQFPNLEDESYRLGSSRIRPVRRSSSNFTDDYVAANLPFQGGRYSINPTGRSVRGDFEGTAIQGGWDSEDNHIPPHLMENRIREDILETLGHEWGHQVTGLPMIRDDQFKEESGHEMAAYILQHPGGEAEHEKSRAEFEERFPESRMVKPAYANSDQL